MLDVPASHVTPSVADVAVYRTSTGGWFIRNSDDGTLATTGWRASALADLPLARRP